MKKLFYIISAIAITAILTSIVLYKEKPLPKTIISEPIVTPHENVNNDFCGQNGENCRLGKG